MKKPNFFIIGAPKCGTTSLAIWLSEHPNIYMSPVKEPNFFCSDLNFGLISSLEKYEGLFKQANDIHIAVGEASTWYLFSQVAVPKIEKTYPEARYIVMVRNPLEMAHSLYCFNLLRDEHISDFKTAWKLSNERGQKRAVRPLVLEPRKLDYQKVCCLGEQLERFFAIVPREKVLVLLLDDIKEDSRREYLKVLRFLHVPDDGRMEFPVKNQASEDRFPLLQKWVYTLGRVWHPVKKKLGIVRSFGIMKPISNFGVISRSRPTISIDVRQELLDYFKNDIEKLSYLINRDLLHWLL